MKLNLPYGRKNVSFRWSQLLKKELLTKHYVMILMKMQMIPWRENRSLGKK